MSPSIALFSQTSSNIYSVKRFLEEAAVLGVSVDHIRYSDIKMYMNHTGAHIICNDKSIVEDYSHFLFRSPKGHNGENFGYYTGIIKNILHAKGKPVLNDDFSMSFRKNHATKLNNYGVLATADVPIVPTYNFATIENLQASAEKFKYPLIVKKARGSHGTQVHITNSLEEIIKIIEKDEVYLYLIQDFIQTESETQEDFRILTIGQEVVGAYKKTATAGTIKTNLGGGGNAESVEMTEQLHSIGEQVIKATGMEFIGIDLIFDRNNNPYVLEINSAPQFEGFEKATKVNVAHKILTYLINK